MNKRIRVLHVGSYPTGGAGRAMQRIGKAITGTGDDESFEVVYHFSMLRREPRRVWIDIAKNVVRLVSRGLFRPGTNVLHSVALVRTGLAKWITSQEFDLVHLHWLGDQTIAIEEIKAINAPIVWTFHDMWPFSGAEHYTTDSRHIDGYLKNNRPAREKGPDINRFTWERKMNHLPKNMVAVTPSRWMASEAKRSQLGSQWDVRVIPYPVDTDIWFAEDHLKARESLGISADAIFLLFVAEKGIATSNKGGEDVLQVAEHLARLQQGKKAVTLGIVGTPNAAISIPLVDVRQFGVVEDDHMLRKIYSAASITLVPSHLDNFPSVVSESMACGTPVSAYQLGGPAEMIQDGETGLLSTPLDPTEMATKISQHIDSDSHGLRRLGENASQYVRNTWSPATVGDAYRELYREVLADRNN